MYIHELTVSFKKFMPGKKVFHVLNNVENTVFCMVYTFFNSKFRIKILQPSNQN